MRIKPFALKMHNDFDFDLYQCFYKKCDVNIRFHILIGLSPIKKKSL